MGVPETIRRQINFSLVVLVVVVCSALCVCVCSGVEDLKG